MDSEQAIAEYLSIVMEDGTPALLVAALGDVARARGMTQLARDTGLAREALYRSLSADGNPSFASVTKVLRALGVKGRPVAVHPGQTRPDVDDAPHMRGVPTG